MEQAVYIDLLFLSIDTQTLYRTLSLLRASMWVCLQTDGLRINLIQYLSSLLEVLSCGGTYTQILHSKKYWSFLYYQWKCCAKLMETPFLFPTVAVLSCIPTLIQPGKELINLGLD